MLRRLTGIAVTTLFLLPGLAEAEIYKYTKKDGSVVYTDKLSQLPRERRAYYLRQQKAQEEERRKLEARIGIAEMQRSELEKKRKALEASQTQAAELAKRRQELTAQINAMDKARSAKLADKATWKKRMKEARAERDALLLAFQKKQKDTTVLAIKPAFTLLPGEAKK